MMVFHDLSHKVKKIFKGRMYRLGQYPSLDWLVSLLFFLFLTLAGLFFTLTNRPELSSPVDSASNGHTLLSQDLLDRVISHYETKRTGFNSLLKNPPNLVDPSK